MEFGAHLPLIAFAGERRGLGDLIAYAQAARDHGYAFLCANDHLVFARPWLDGPTALATTIEHSGEMTLATTVALGVVRGPAATAKTLGAIDVLSGGRLVVGIGPGSSRRDYELVGLDFDERCKRLDEAILALRAFWAATPFEGRYYSATGFVLEPAPVQRPAPPIWVGSWGSEAGLRRVGRLADGWLASGYNTTPARFADGLRLLPERLAAAGREAAGFPSGIATMWTFVTEDAATAERILGDVLAPMLNRPLDALREQVLVGPAEECARKLRAYAEAGAQRVFIWPVADELDQLERFRSGVVPLVELAS